MFQENSEWGLYKLFLQNAQKNGSVAENIDAYAAGTKLDFGRNR